MSKSSNKTYAIGIYQPTRETPKAVLDALWGWIPKSQIIGVFESKTSAYVYFVIPMWLKRKISPSDWYAGGKVWEVLDENDLRGLDKEYDKVS